MVKQKETRLGGIDGPLTVSSCMYGLNGHTEHNSSPDAFWFTAVKLRAESSDPCFMALV